MCRHCGRVSHLFVSSDGGGGERAGHIGRVLEVDDGEALLLWQTKKPLKEMGNKIVCVFTTYCMS